MYALITLKFKKYLNKSNQEKVYRNLGASNSVVSGQIWLKFELIQALMHTCSYYHKILNRLD